MAVVRMWERQKGQTLRTGRRGTPPPGNAYAAPHPLPARNRREDDINTSQLGRDIKSENDDDFPFYFTA